MTREILPTEIRAPFYAICPGNNGKGGHLIPIYNNAGVEDLITCITHSQQLVVQENPKWARLSEDQTSNNESF